MTQLLIEIKADGKYCGGCKIRLKNTFSECSLFDIEFLKHEHHNNHDDALRCPACLDAEKRAKELME